MLPRTLRGRFLAAYGLSLLLTCVSLALLLWVQVRHTIHEEFEKRGEALAQVLSSDVRATMRSRLDPTNPAGFSPQALAALQERVQSLLSNEDVELATVQDQAGQLLAQAGVAGSDLRWFRTEMTMRAWQPQRYTVMELRTPDGAQLTGFSLPVFPEHSSIAVGAASSSRVRVASPAEKITGLGVVRVGLSARRALGRVNRALFVSLGAGIALTLLGLIGMVSLTRWTLRPLGRMAQIARAVAQGDLSQRVAVESLDEVGTLARAFGEMTESLSLSRAELDHRNHALLEAVTEKERLYRETECSLTELRNAQSRLAYSEEARRMDRLRTVGQMASGIAHNFNNVLSVIIGRVQILKLRSEACALPPATIADGLDVIERAGLDGAETVRRLQEFSRGESPQRPVPSDLNEIIRGILEITKPRWKDQVERNGVHIRAGLELQRLPHVAVVASEIREVLTNLIFNAVDAMPHGGDLTIGTDQDARGIRLWVRDSGIGMPPAVRERVFDPFYTTKGVKGTGLGLSTVYGIVKRHGGEIEVHTQEGKGTVFTITLPPTQPAGAGRSEETMMQHQPWRILVGDDESNVRDVLVELLQMFGHEVHAASGGAEILRSMKTNAYDLVFTDLGMPDMSGWEVAEEIRKDDPAIPIILATGWGSQISPADAEARGVTRVLAKPYTFQKISSVIAEIQGMRQAA
jgi:signal transduction histidine kinase/CheY-like chemotaxis protein